MKRVPATLTGTCIWDFAHSLIFLNFLYSLTMWLILSHTWPNLMFLTRLSAFIWVESISGKSSTGSQIPNFPPMQDFYVLRGIHRLPSFNPRHSPTIHFRDSSLLVHILVTVAPGRSSWCIHALGGIMYEILWLHAGRGIYLSLFASLYTHHAMSSRCVSGLTPGPICCSCSSSSVQEWPIWSRCNSTPWEDWEVGLPFGCSTGLPGEKKDVTRPIVLCQGWLTTVQRVLSQFIECRLIDSQFVDDFFHFSYSQSATV